MIRVRLQEARGNLDSARTLLQRAGGTPLSQEEQRHAAVLLRVDSALDRSLAYELEGSIELAEQELAGLRIDSTDHALRLAVDARLGKLREVRRLEAGSAALTIARALHEQRNYDLAIAQYERIHADTGDLYPISIQTAAAAEMARSRRAKADENGFIAGLVSAWRQTRHGLGILLVWLAIVGAAVLLFLGYRRLRGPRKGAMLDVDDMTASTEERDRAKLRLLRDISRALRVIAHTRGTSIGENVEDLDGVANLRTQSPVFESIDKLVADGTLQVGPVAINPKQLVTLFGALQDRPFRTTLKGYLTTDGANTSLLFIERYDIIQQRKVKASHYYQTLGMGEDGRREAIRDFAIHYLFDHTSERPTSVFESFRDYCRGLDYLEAPAGANGGDPLKPARAAFESAVYLDPQNWLARFKLAEVMRKQGDYRGAVQHFEELQRLSQDPDRQPESLQRYLRTSPEFPFVIDYHLALTLSLGFDHAAQKRAIGMFGDLIEGIEQA